MRSAGEAIDQLKAQKKDGDITEDDLKEEEKDAQNLIDKYSKEIDKSYEVKKKELMEI